MRYKRILLLGLENDPVSVSLPTFSSDKRKTCRRQGETTVNNDQTATASADELKPQANWQTYSEATIKHQLIVDVQHHRKVFPSHQLLLAKPNRTFGLSSFSTRMCCMNWCVIKGVYYLDQKTNRCQSLCRLSLLIRERRVADKAKSQLIIIKRSRRAQTSWLSHCK